MDNCEITQRCGGGVLSHDILSRVVKHTAIEPAQSEWLSTQPLIKAAAQDHRQQPCRTPQRAQCPNQPRPTPTATHKCWHNPVWACAQTAGCNSNRARHLGPNTTVTPSVVRLALLRSLALLVLPAVVSLLPLALVRASLHLQLAHCNTGACFSMTPIATQISSQDARTPVRTMHTSGAQTAWLWLSSKKAAQALPLWYYPGPAHGWCCHSSLIPHTVHTTSNMQGQHTGTVSDVHTTKPT